MTISRRAFQRESVSIAALNVSANTLPARAFWRSGLLLWIVVLLLSVPQAALLPLLDRDEPRFAEASREMLQSGDIIIPTFNHDPRYAKPPLIYWCQALSFTVFGENAFAARLPSLLATAGTAFLLFAWGVRLGSACVGMIAALAYAFCLQTMQQGRVATADALLIFFMTLTAYTGWRLLGHRHPPKGQAPPRSIFRTGSAFRAWSFRLALALAAAFLAKGPEAWLVVVPLLVVAQSWRGRLFYCGCVLLSLLLVTVWALPACVLSHGDYLKEGIGHDVLDRMTGALLHPADANRDSVENKTSEVSFQGHGASTLGWYLLGVPLYLLLFWISALPWSPLLLTHRKKLFAAWKLDRVDAYLLLNAALIYLVFSLGVTKLPHYTLPAFPFLALLFARRWVAAELHPRLPTQLAAGLGLGLALITVIGVPYALAHGATPSPVGALVGEARDALSPETSFAFVDFREPNGIWEMRRISRQYGQFISASEAISFLHQSGPRAVVLTTASWQSLHAIPDPAWKIVEARGWNTAKGWDAKAGTFAFIDLTLVAKR